MNEWMEAPIYLVECYSSWCCQLRGQITTYTTFVQIHFHCWDQNLTVWNEEFKNITFWDACFQLYDVGIRAADSYVHLPILFYFFFFTEILISSSPISKAQRPNDWHQVSEGTEKRVMSRPWCQLLCRLRCTTTAFCSHWSRGDRVRICSWLCKPKPNVLSFI